MRRKFKCCRRHDSWTRRKRTFGKGCFMFSRKTPMRAVMFGAAAMALAVFAVPQGNVAFAANSEVKAVVNNVAITSGDVAKRANFLRLQHQKGDLNKMAQQQMIDETLKIG